ncbi:hypothetical protein [Acinetobacter pittii]|uniref:Uncharacterized protein n=1 Tax=Acinetobacter pittii TaxID=48296 RepID=A0A6H0G092_ACIPI|nr:hypothetical protein [Acinetobacter pittii]QIT19962.1 hypothetical protein G8E09_19305 [Acinetobacter pittii]
MIALLTTFYSILAFMLTLNFVGIKLDNGKTTTLLKLVILRVLCGRAIRP